MQCVSAYVGCGVVFFGANRSILSSSKSHTLAFPWHFLSSPSVLLGICRSTLSVRWLLRCWKTNVRAVMVLKSKRAGALRARPCSGCGVRPCPQRTARATGRCRPWLRARLLLLPFQVSSSPNPGAHLDAEAGACSPPGFGTPSACPMGTGPGVSPALQLPFRALGATDLQHFPWQWRTCRTWPLALCL